MSCKAVFMDRDGVINQDFGYVYEIEKLKLIDGVVEGLKIFRSLGYKLILVTNQSGIARGYFTKEQYGLFTDHLQAVLQKHGAQFDDIMMCPHLKGAPIKEYDVQCECRKPKPGMILQAALRHDIDLPSSIMIGDHASDLEAGRAAGTGTLILCGEHEKEERAKLQDLAYRFFPTLKDCADYFLQDSCKNKNINED